MDPDSSYLLKIRLTGNPKKSRKDFSYFKITKVVDSDLCNFKDFVEEIVDQYPHSYNEIVHVFYHDDVQKTIPQVTTDQELLEMFRKHATSKVIHMTISYSEPIPTISEPTEPTTSHPTQLTNDDDDDGYLANPQPQNEHVGVDDEGLYLTTHNMYVKKNPRPHKCSSARRSKNVKNATKFWICEQV
ncbi:hypothetical protein BS78_K252300, partial [Paspalum vaginatum]